MCRFVATAACALALVSCEGEADRKEEDPAAVTPSACAPEGEKMHPPMASRAHVNSIRGIRYDSNPPSSGPHCPAPGRYGVYETSDPLRRCNWIHNLEHGAIVLLYNCPQGCPDVVADLLDVMKQAGADPDCGASKRLVLTPDPELDVPVAAAAWGYTWKGCLNDAGKAELVTFIDKHLGSRGRAPEAGLCP